MKKLTPQSSKKNDEVSTPECAVIPLLPYINPEWTIYEAAYGKGILASHFIKRGFKVIGEGRDFLKDYMDEPFDCIITNPPYSLKFEFLRTCYDYGKPFAMLLPLTALEGTNRQKLFKEHGISLIIPDKRINFINSEYKSGSYFMSAWYCYKLPIPQQINFVEMKK